MHAELLKRITIIPGLMGGKPTIRGMRFPVKDVLELLGSGMSNKEILQEHPALEEDDIKASLLYAALKVGNTTILNAA
ncbi:MAG: DUF433 domain-containing protein [Gloeobacteraceae cyanobacterium ES-bin-316]|nr:DUF433 domain-containing protein [Ferruginibacter sp.]